MKTNNRILILPLILIVTIAILAASCKKKKSDLPVLTTSAVTGISSTKASCGGEISSDGGSSITACGVCWNTSESPTISNNKTNEGSSTGTFTSTINGLTLGTTYYVRAYATNGSGTAYGDQVSFTATYGIGDTYQGGKIFYVFVSGDPGYVSGQVHGIIAATSDQSNGIQWSNGSNTTTGANSNTDGNTNTNTIVSSQGSGSYAAKICYDLSLGGYSDWYLPSKVELTKLFQNRAAIGGLPGANYWSSTEYASSPAGNAWFYYTLGNGYPNYANKSNSYYVRAVRTF
jgi:hypothetical protein